MTLSKNTFETFKPAELKFEISSFTPMLSCYLRWRRGRLWVYPATQDKVGVALPALASEDWFRACLLRSSVKSVCIDPASGLSAVTLWSRACEVAQKPLYLKLPSSASLPQKRYPVAWAVKQGCDRMAALLLLLSLSPVLLVIAGLIKIQDGGSVFFTQQRVGQRGKLFRIIKFRSMVIDAEKLHSRVMANQTGLHKLECDPRVTPLGRWLRKLSLDELPQLINVLRGEMSLVGPRPWALYDAIRIKPELHQRLNALPGMTGAWQIEARSEQLDLDAVTEQDLQYLKNWSLWQDLKILLLTVPSVLKGHGAY
ncbi:MAG: sugar transferase [Elainella sp. Prado103]|nr:sugar transferase [Elainella sp. Prado103]